MRLSIFILLLPLLLKAQWKENIQFGSNPGDLEMSIYFPRNASNIKRKIPMVVALHGCSQNSHSMAEQSGWNELADRYNFIVLYPDQRRKNNGMNCFNWFELEDISKNSGESSSIIQMLDFAIKNYNVDPESVFTYGLSAGAAMAVALMATYPEKFKGGAIFAGAPYKTAINKKEGWQAMNHVKDLSPEEWAQKVEYDSQIIFPKLILFHGEKDKIVPIKYSYELIDQWSILTGTAQKPDKFERNFEGNSNVTRSSCMDKNLQEQIIFYQFSNLKHEIAVDPGHNEKQGGKTSMYSKDIDFFSTYWVVEEFGLNP